MGRSCSRSLSRGGCTNGKIIAAEKVELRVIEGVRTRLLSPEAIADAVRRQHERLTAQRREILASRAPIKRELSEIERRFARAQEMCLNEAISIAELKTLTERHAARRTELEAKLASLDEPSEVALHGGAARAYGKLAEQLHNVLDGEKGEKARTALRQLIERVDFQPLKGLRKYDRKGHGKLAALLGVSERAAASHDCEVLVGAGTGFEPVTFRL